MGLLDNIVKAGLGKVLSSNSSSQGSNSMQDKVVEVLLEQVLGKKEQGGVGGLGNLVDMMKGKGLDDVINSWVGQGQNQNVNAQQIEQGLDANTLESISAKLGTSKSETASQLSDILPGLVDKLTPKGQADNELGLDDAVNVLSKLFK